MRKVPDLLRRAAVLAAGVSAALALGSCKSLMFAAANAPSAFGSFKSQRGMQYGALNQQVVDVYTPTKADSPRPIVVFAYGGGWVNGSKDDYRFVADALTSRGFVAVLPNYRLYPEVKFPLFIDDIAQAIAWTHRRAREFGGDPGRIYVMGHSAGAHITSMIALNDEYMRKAGGDRTWIKGFIGLSGPYDFLPLTDEYLFDLFGPESQYPKTQPVNFVTSSATPALLIHGEQDQVVWPKNSRSLAAEYRRHRAHVTERYYSEMDHADVMAALSAYYRGRRPILDEIAAFIAANDGIKSVAQNTARQDVPSTPDGSVAVAVGE